MASGVCVLLRIQKGLLEINTNSPMVYCRTFPFFSFTGISGSENLFFFFNSFIFLVALGLHCCMQSFSSCGEWGLLSSNGAWASRCGGFFCFQSMASVAPRRGVSFWTKGIKTMSPTLVGRFLTTATPPEVPPFSSF